MGTLMENVVLFSRTLLQKLYSGTVVGDSENLLNFLADQIVVVSGCIERHVYTALYTDVMIHRLETFVFTILN